MFKPETEAAYHHYAALRINKTSMYVSFHDVIRKTKAALILSRKYRASGLSDVSADKAAIEVVEAWNDRYTADHTQHALELCEIAEVKVLGGDGTVKVITTIDPFGGDPGEPAPFTVTITLELTALTDFALGQLSK
jgi:hypothetical protein